MDRASKNFQPLDPRPPVEDRVHVRVHEFCQVANIHPARWNNTHGGCQVQSLFHALSIFDLELLRTLANSEDEEHPMLRTSLANYINDGYTTDLDERRDADLNADGRLLLDAVHDGLETLTEKGKKTRQLLPTTLSNTVTALFQHLSFREFNEHLTVAFPAKGLKVAEIRTMMQEHPALVVKARRLPVTSLRQLAQGYNGTIGLMVEVGMEMTVEQGEDEEEEGLNDLGCHSRPRTKTAPKNDSPNITFQKWPPNFEEATISINFKAQDGKGWMRWKGTLRGDAYKCVKQKKVRCQAPNQKLPRHASEDQAKELIVRHKLCCPGTEIGKTFTFPIQ